MNIASQEEAERRVYEAASKLASAIRLGADPAHARTTILGAVRLGAEQLAQDTVEEFEKGRA